MKTLHYLIRIGKHQSFAVVLGKSGERTLERQSKMRRFEGKTVIVTGGGTGIGEAICHRFADEGANVVIAELEVENGEGTAANINGGGGVAMFCQTDTSNSDSVRSMIACAVGRFGTVDILVNNAAAFVFGKVEEVTDADWARVFGVNVIGYANCVREVLPTFRKAGGGAVVNIASVSSFIAQPEFVPYNSSKGAVAQLTRCLAMDLALDNIRVNAVCPGSIKTRATDMHIDSLGLDREESYVEFGQSALMKRMGEPREIAAVVAFLASDDASYMTGEHVIVDGGMSIG